MTVCRGKLRGIALLLALIAALFTFNSAAFAAIGDMVGLYDWATESAPRANTYDSNFDGPGDYYEMMIRPLFDNGTPVPDEGWFSTVAEALAITWSHNTAGMNNGVIDTSTMEAVLNPAGDGYYLYVVSYNDALTLGADSWRATHTSGAVGDFSWVATDYDTEDPASVTVSNISVEFHDLTTPTANPFAKGASLVSGGDDYFNSTVYGGHGRSYPTAIDAVARCMQIVAPYGINNYSKLLPYQLISSVTGRDGILHAADSINKAWLWAAYYSTDGGITWTRDDTSYAVGPDDYELQAGALIVWKLVLNGNYLTESDWEGFFPSIM